MATDEITTDEVAPQDEVKFASLATVKRTKGLFDQGTAGILVLTDTKLIFLAGGSTQWEIPRTSIADVKKPWYGMGSWVTFNTSTGHYGLAFGRRGATKSLVSGSDLAIRYGGAIGAQAGVLGDALAVAQMRAAAQLGGQWYALLGART